MDLVISIIGAIAAIFIAVISSLLAHKNNLRFQNRKLKEEHYVRYMEAVHNLAANTNKETLSKYTFARDKMFLIADENVISHLLEFENKAVGKYNGRHDEYLTELIIAIRKDLGIKDKNIPTISLKK